MRRRTFDVLLSSAGLIMAVVLLVAGGLLTWASAFVNGQVHDQLTEQGIIMPEGEAIAEPQYEPLREYAGEQMSTGRHAYVYAEYYIKNHLPESSYAELGDEINEARAAGDDEAVEELQAMRDTAFRGETLRGLLLYGYAFATMGEIAGYAAIAAYIGAVLMLVLSLLGLRHARKAGDATLP